MQRIDAILAAANNLRDLIIDASPVSLTGSSLKFDALIHPNTRQLQGRYAYIYSGAGAGQSRVAGTINTSNREVLFTQVFASLPSLNSSVLMTREFDKSEYDNALNRAIGKAKTKYLQDKVATLSLVATQYEYPVPTAMEWISSLRFVPSNNTDYQDSNYVSKIFELPPRYWRIEINALGTYVIVVDPRKINLDTFDNHWMLVQGQIQANPAATDNATIPADLEEYVVAGASMHLAGSRIDEKSEWKAKFALFRKQFDDLETSIFRYGRGRKVRT